MTADEVQSGLDGIADVDDFADRSSALVDIWSAKGAGVETVEPVLRFMEAHPDIDFGMPGPLVHFMERFYRGGYEEALVESVNRQPRAHTVWLLNRVLNGTTQSQDRQHYVEVMHGVLASAVADEPSRQAANHFLERLT